eukprot:1151233-Pelagomonas_calceolata.AAC.3
MNDDAEVLRTHMHPKHRLGKARKERKKRKTMQAEKTLPTSIREKEKHWLRRAINPLHHEG